MSKKCVFTNGCRFSFKRIILALVISSVMFSSMTGCYFFPMEEDTLAPPLKEPESVTYDTMDVKKGNIENKISVSADFISVDQVDVSFEYGGGYIKDIPVKLGDVVKKGEVLAVLDTEDLTNQVRQQELVVKKLQLSCDRLKTEMDVQGGGDRYSLEQAQIDLEIAKLQLENLNTRYDRAKLVSPINGIVDYINDTNIGEFINPRQTFMRVADPSKLQLHCDSGDISRFSLGMKVLITYNDKDYDGKVVMTAENIPAAEFERLRNTVRFSIAQIPDGAQIGDTARVGAILEKKDDVIVLPKSVVHNYLGRRFVNVLDNGIVSERDVETGIESATEYEIVKGLEVGEKVVR